MGLAIYYRGCLDHSGSVDRFCKETADMAKDLGWKYRNINECINILDINNIILKGIVMYPHPVIEPLSFVVDTTGRLRNYFVLKNMKDIEVNDFWHFVITQSAPIQIHMSIIRLLKDLKKKYISNLNVYDDGEYWEREDKILLKDRVAFYNREMQVFDNVKKEKSKQNKDTPSFIYKIEKLIKDRFR